MGADAFTFRYPVDGNRAPEANAELTLFPFLFIFVCAPRRGPLREHEGASLPDRTILFTS